MTGEEDQVVNDALKSLDATQLKAVGIDPSSLFPGEVPGQDAGSSSSTVVEKPPVCERCHNLLHHNLGSGGAGAPMYHPTVDTLRQTIEESPHKYNHVYHVIDAADFPMSLIPRLHVLIGDIQLRTRNRRSRTKFTHDRKIEMTFIITRADLLAPTKEQLDRMMPYLREELREALGRVGGRVRLGNVRCVSAKRGWWTPQVKEDIWKRGGAGWMVGKVNVGKSQLFEAIYPKGRLGAPQVEKAEHAVTMYPRADDERVNEDDSDFADLEVGELLPPLQQSMQYPDMPLVSSLPGTTVSPIRVPFGNKKGELIDLPGLERSGLELFVKPNFQKSLIMKSRIVPEQHSVTPGRSLLLGGRLIRITPRTPNMTFLCYNFTPLKEHLTSTEKAIQFQDGDRTIDGVEDITVPETPKKIQHAGTFRLAYDVTKRRAGPLVRKEAVGMNVEDLPFRVLSIDILVEGVGFIEVVAQIRTRDLKDAYRRARAAAPPTPVLTEEKKATKSDDPFSALMSERRDDTRSRNATPSRPAPKTPAAELEQEPELDIWPEVDVYTPEGSFIGTRRPIEGWMNNRPLIQSKHKKSRPRKSMTGAKKNDKEVRRGKI